MRDFCEHMRGMREEWHERRGFFRGGHDEEPFGRGRHGGRHWHGGGRGYGRPFDHGELRYVILELIAEKPRHGYEIIRTIEERLGGSYAPSPGVVYPTLTMLEEMGYAAMQEEGGRKLYSATEAGREHLAANRPARDEERERFRGRGFSPQLMRSMHNLKLALRLRLRQGPITEEQLTAIAAALDTATAAIERS